MRHALPLCLLLFAATALAASPPVAPTELQARIVGDSPPLVLDVRTADEYGAGHVPGAVLIPHDQLEARIGELGSAREVVVYCRTGRRSALIEPLLEAHGFRVRQLEGSWQAWQAAGLPIEREVAAESQP